MNRELAAKLERDALIKLLHFEEGFRAQPYKDTLGHWTIGYGHLVPNSKSAVAAQNYYSQLQALAKQEGVTMAVVLQELFEEDLEQAIEGAKTTFDGGYFIAPPSVRIALVSLVFQLGTTKLSTYSSTLDMVKQMRYDDLAISMSKWLLAQQAPNRLKRYQRLLRAHNLGISDACNLVYDMIKGR